MHLLTLNINSADFEISITGTDKITTYEEITENYIFMTYENTFQFTTNTSMFGYGTCSGAIEIIDGKNIDNILCVHTDSYGNKGYFKTINSDKTKIIRNMIGKTAGSSVASWKLLNGNGPYKELVGLVLRGAYYWQPLIAPLHVQSSQCEKKLFLVSKEPSLFHLVFSQ